jgi:Putative Flp pilus-assembly TadE/G-like/Putative Tad-like Flp pilus-assembly
MKSPLVRRTNPQRGGKRDCGVTIILVALSMIGILAMAALSIDVITLYLARLEAQRSADAAALTAARIISITGVTGDPNNTSTYWSQICNGATSAATEAAKAVGSQNSVGGTNANTITVNYLYNGSAADCSSPSGGFPVNPQAQVTVTRTSLPTFFARIWGATSQKVTATATAEAYNPSGSNGLLAKIIPVQPRCVKPWIIPNRDPLNVAGCTGACNTFAGATNGPTNGSITNPGFSANGGGVIGEQFLLYPDCQVGTPSSCVPRGYGIKANHPVGVGAHIPTLPNLPYLPGEAPSTTPVAVPSCKVSGTLYEEAIEGCDQSTLYQCGVQDQNLVDLAENPASGDTTNGVKCLIHEQDATASQPDGQDTINASGTGTFYPLPIFPGSSNPVTSLSSTTPITTSNSIVSLPIYDDTRATINGTGTTNVTIVGFLQVFINSVDQHGNINVTVLNVAGCGNGTPPPGPAVAGSSPVPVRLITPP